MIKKSKLLHGIYSIVPDEGGNDLWVEIGYATRHADGRGFDLTLRALPLDSKLVLREPLDEPLTTGLQDRAAPSLARQVKEFERAAIKQCLLETGGNVGAVLKGLKIPRRTLSEKMARLGIDRSRLARRFRQKKAGKAKHALQSAANAGGHQIAKEERSRTWAIA